MMCVDANQDGKVDFNEFTDRFHDPAKDIGFNVAVLLTNLSEHMPNDTRYSFTSLLYVELLEIIPHEVVRIMYSAIIKDCISMIC